MHENTVRFTALGEGSAFDTSEAFNDALTYAMKTTVSISNEIEASPQEQPDS